MERTLSSNLVFKDNSPKASWALRIVAALLSWQRRIATRAELARLDARLLADAGISEAQRYDELTKPFWR
jgi:uncharacterized protein YjiS (DUF1127 family)